MSGVGVQVQPKVDKRPKALIKIDSIKPCSACRMPLAGRSARARGLVENVSRVPVASAGRLVQHSRDWGDGHLAMGLSGRL